MPKTALECIARLRSVLPRAMVSVELEKPGREGLREVVAESDVVFFSRAWVEVRGPLTGLPKEAAKKKILKK